MWPVIVDVVAAVVAGGLVTFLAWRWPHAPVAAPQVEPSTIRTEVRRHGRLARMLQARIDPQATTGLALTVAGAVVIIGGVGVGLLLFMVRRNLGFAKWDLSAARFGAQHATSASTAVLRNLSLLGGTIGLIVVVALTLVIEQRRIPHRAAIGFLLLVVVGQNLLANGIKVLVNRARPDLSQLTGFAGSSFPSGHSTAAAATYAAIALLLSRRRPPATRSLLAGGAAAIAVAIAASRVLLGVHWLTDVMAGLALGWAWFAACSIAFGGRLMRFGAPVEVAEQAAEAQAHGRRRNGAQLPPPVPDPVPASASGVIRRGDEVSTERGSGQAGLDATAREPQPPDRGPEPPSIRSPIVLPTRSARSATDPASPRPWRARRSATRSTPSSPTCRSARGRAPSSSTCSAGRRPVRAHGA